MRPRNVLILVCLILALGMSVRWATLVFRLSPPQTEYKKAVQLTITYQVGSKKKQIVISNPTEVKFILDGIRPYRRDESTSSGVPPNSCTVDFHFANGEVIQTIVNNGSLERPNWERMYTPEFYNRLQNTVSRLEGRAIDLSKNNPAAAPEAKPKRTDARE